MRLIFSILLLLLCFPGMATTDVTLRFVPTYGGKPIVLEEHYYKFPSGDSIMFETFKAYISNVAFYLDDKKAFAEQNSYHLLNASDEATMSFTVQPPERSQFNYISFDLGVDSATSTSGALGGDLDPAKGMFWTWQSGYINCKIEGRSNLCKTRHNEFQLHLGGYAQQDDCLQQLKLSLDTQNRDNDEIVIEISLDEFIAQIDLRKENAIMSPGSDAVMMARKLASVFTAK